MYSKRVKQIHRVKRAALFRTLAVRLVGVFVLICFSLPSAWMHGAHLVFDDPRFIEGDEGAQVYEIELGLNEISSQPVRVDYVTRAGSASEDEDYVGRKGSLVFVPGSLKPGLPRPDVAEDSLTRSLVLEEGWGIDVLAEVEDPVGLAFPPMESAFGESLYVGSLNQNGIGVRDYIVRINYLGEVEDFVFLLPEADPTSLEFPPLNSRYGDFLYVSANNRDGARPGDQGGTVQRISREGEVIDFTPIGIPFGPGEPGELAFGLGTDFGDLLYLVNSVGSPGDILSVLPDGTLDVVVDDGLLEDQDAGLAARSLAIDLRGDYGGIAFFGEFGRRCSCLKKLYPDGRVESWVRSLPGDPHAIVFAPEGPFEGRMYVALDDGAEGSIIRVLPNGEFDILLSGLQGFLNGNGKDVIAFSHDGSVMYVADYFSDRIYRIAPTGNLALEVLGDLGAEPDETVEIFFFDPKNVELPREFMLVTIENDDEGDQPPVVQLESPITVLEDSGAQSFLVRLQDDQASLEQLKIEVEVQDPGLIGIQTVQLDEAKGGLSIELEPLEDQFGFSRLDISVTDTGGNIVVADFPVSVLPVNDPPVLSPIGDVIVAANIVEVAVPLSGIGSGARNEADVLTLKVSVRGDEPKPLVTLSYESPSETGRLFASVEHYDLVAGREFWVEVMVDDSADEASEARQSFLLSFEASVPKDPFVDQPPTVRIQSPKPFQIVSPDFDFQPALADVPIRLEAFDDRGIDRVEIFANGQAIGEIRGQDEPFVWEGVSVGDYRLVAKAYDDAGQSSESESVDVAVSTSVGSVAIVRNHDNVEIGFLAEYLYEMGYESDLFWSSGLDVELLAPYDLVIWHQAQADGSQLERVIVERLIELFDAGMPFYFIGGLGDGALDDPWTMFSGFAVDSKEFGPVSISFNGEAIEEMKNGRYGALNQESFESVSNYRVSARLGSSVIAVAGDRPVMVASSGADEVTGEGARRVSQVFSVNGPHAEGREDLFRGLFQNSVCWLLRCNPCSAVDLELLEATDSVSSEASGEVRYTVRVKHSGECEGTAVRLGVTLPDGGKIVQAASSRGRVEMLPSGLHFELGRMASASEASLEWTVAYSQTGIFELAANLQSNNIEVTDVNNQFAWRTVVSEVPTGGLPKLQMRGTSAGALEISVALEGGAKAGEFMVQRSRDLRSWVNWKLVPVGVWKSVENRPSSGGEFFRAILNDVD